MDDDYDFVGERDVDSKPHLSELGKRKIGSCNTSQETSKKRKLSNDNNDIFKVSMTKKARSKVATKSIVTKSKVVAGSKVMTKSKVLTKGKIATKKKKTVVKKTAFRNFQKIEEIVKGKLKDGWYFTHSDNHMMFSPLGRDAPCHTVGIDVGKKHLGLSGLYKDEDMDHPICTWMGLVSVPSRVADESSDKFDDMISKDEKFEWVRSSINHRIEQQVGDKNISAQVIAGGLRSCLRTILHGSNSIPNVEFVHGNNKYKVAPRYSQEARDDPLRLEKLTGPQGKKLRKILGENDCKNLLIENGETDMIEFLTLFGKCVDQLHDMTDAYLVARWMYEPDGFLPTRKIQDIKREERLKNKQTKMTKMTKKTKK